MLQPCFTETDSPDILEMKRGGGCQAAFGLPLLFAGLFILQIPFGFIPAEIDEGPLILAIIMPLGLVFAIAGAALILGRNGIRIDRRNHTITQWWGLLFPMKKKEYRLDTFRAVRLDCSPGDACVVNLMGQESQTFYIPSPGDYESALRTAEQLSRFLEKPLEDLLREEMEDENE